MLPKIEIRFLVIGMFVLIAALTAPSFAFAGGWAVVTLDQLPDNVIVGEPYPLGMMVRQHGHTPWLVDEIRIEASHPETGKTATFIAKPDQRPGHYRVELLFPRPGRWEWGIASGLFPMQQPMPALEVADVGKTFLFAPKRLAQDNVGVPDVLLALLGFFALMGFAFATLMVIRGRDTLPAVGLMILCGGLVILAFTNTEVKPVLPIPQTAGGRPTGRQLFLAKGCVVCHINNRVIEQSEAYSVNTSLNLSDYRNDPAFLRKFLGDPQSIRAMSGMPDLNLAPEEIEALVIFINDQE